MLQPDNRMDFQYAAVWAGIFQWDKDPEYRKRVIEIYDDFKNKTSKSRVGKLLKSMQEFGKLE